MHRHQPSARSMLREITVASRHRRQAAMRKGESNAFESRLVKQKLMQLLAWPDSCDTIQLLRYDENR